MANNGTTQESNGTAAGELREDIPLRARDRTKEQSACDKFLSYCCGCWWGECFKGLGLIYTTFAALTAAVTIALFAQIYYGYMQVQPHGSVATDNIRCSLVGTQILQLGGNAVDAAISATLCLAVVNPHTTGLAAGGVLMVYSHRTRSIPNIIDFARVVPSDKSELPRLISGLAYSHQQFGHISWQTIVQPAVNIARQGFLVPKTLATAIELSGAYNLYNGPLTPDQVLQLPNLANTLQIIANLSDEQLYSYITPQNQPLKSQAINSTFGRYNVYIPNIPTITPTFFTVLESLKDNNVSKDEVNEPEYAAKLARIIQQTYSDLNVNAFYEETSSTVSVVDKDDLYVSLVSGLHGMLGSMRLNVYGLGYIEDNPPQTELETMNMPVIITDKHFVCGRRMIFGTSDISLAAQIISSLIIGQQNITTSIENPRFRILNVTNIGIEESYTRNFTDETINNLATIGHIISLAEPFDSINIVEMKGDVMSSHSDSRGDGFASRF